MIIQTVGIVGTGVIGASWTALCLAKGLRVIATDPAPGAYDRLCAYVSKAWPALRDLEGLQVVAQLNDGGEQRWQAEAGESRRVEEAPPLKTRLSFECDIGTFLEQLGEGEMQWVQENGPEKLAFKRQLFAQLDAAAPPSVVLASSSSAIPSSAFITDCKRDASRILIGHPFNPPHLIPCVEVVPHPTTSPSITSLAMSFYADTLSRRPILLHKEVPGHVGNRLQSALCHEAWSLVARGVVSARDLDACVTSSLGLRWALTGPLLTNVLGGGGGKDGFRKFMRHIGPAFVDCKRDMDEQQRQLGEWVDDTAGDGHASEGSAAAENVAKVEASVLEELAEMDAERLDEERIRELIRLIKSKKGTSQLV